MADKPRGCSVCVHDFWQGGDRNCKFLVILKWPSPDTDPAGWKAALNRENNIRVWLKDNGKEHFAEPFYECLYFEDYREGKDDT